MALNTFAQIKAAKKIVMSVPLGSAATGATTDIGFLWSIPLAIALDYVPPATIDGACPTSAGPYFPALTAPARVISAELINNDPNATLPSLELWDLIWISGNFAVNVAGSYPITSPAFPARDRNGSSNGIGYRLFGGGFDSAATSYWAAVAMTINYTNSAGTSGRVATLPFTPTSNTSRSLLPMTLQGNDDGVRSVQGYDITIPGGTASNKINLCVARRIGKVAMNATTAPTVLTNTMAQRTSFAPEGFLSALTPVLPVGTCLFPMMGSPKWNAGASTQINVTLASD